MSYVSSPTRQKSWQDSRQRVSVLAALAIHKQTVVEKLAALRDQHDLTQEKAAQKVGVTVRQWQRWESGESVPYPRNLDAIAAKFGFQVAEFFTDGEPKPASATAKTQLDRIETLLEENQRLIRALAAGLMPETPAAAGPPWASLDRLLGELDDRDRAASPSVPPGRRSSTG